MPEMILGNYVTHSDPFPKGTHVAICYAVVDLGTHEEKGFTGEKRLVRKCAIIWEFPKLRIDLEDEYGNKENLPRARRQFYTLSLSPKSNLRKHLTSWRGEAFTDDEIKSFDVFNLVGMPAYIQIIHEKRDDGSLRDKLDAIMPLPEEFDVPELENPTLAYAFDTKNNCWPEFPDNMPEWIRNQIHASVEWIKINGVKEGRQEAEETKEPSKSKQSRRRSF